MRVANQSIANYHSQNISKPKDGTTLNQTTIKSSVLQNDSLDISDEAKKMYDESKASNLTARAASSYETTIRFQGYDITFEVRPGNINLDYDSELRDLVYDSSASDIRDLANRMKEIYKRHVGESFSVSSTSMVFEIAAHVYPDEIADFVEDNIDLFPRSIRDDVQDVIDSIQDRTRVINIGEDDEERVVFDAIADYLNMYDFFDVI